MNDYDFTLAGASLVALGSGALHWPARGLLCVSDLHLGKSERRARLGTAPLPPYETQDTLARLQADLAATEARTVICLGDSFDDPAAATALRDADRITLAALQAGRRWIWIEGNHDPGPVGLGGTHLADLPMPPLTFRHIAKPGAQPGQPGEVSGHYHPKTTLRTRAGTVMRPAFLIDADRVILPAYGTYTGGLRSDAAPLAGLMRPGAVAVLTGDVPHPVPLRP